MSGLSRAFPGVFRLAQHRGDGTGPGGVAFILQRAGGWALEGLDLASLLILYAISIVFHWIR